MNRRDFLRYGGTGLGGIALLSLLGEQKLLAGNSSAMPPQWSPEKPNAPRPPHFPAKAKNVVVIFRSGACAHLKTWDYKPELIKRHGQPMPGSDNLITFQGENGNLTKPHWEFKPRGQSGKMISDMLPHLAELADEMCFIHSMTAKSNTHGPAENQMGTGFVLDGFPSMGSWVSYALGTENQDLPAFVAIPDPRGVPQVGPNHWSSAFLPPVFQGTAFTADQPIPNLATPKSVSPAAEAGTRDFLKFLNDRHLARHPRQLDGEDGVHDPDLVCRPVDHNADRGVGELHRTVEWRLHPVPGDELELDRSDRRRPELDVLWGGDHVRCRDRGLGHDNSFWVLLGCDPVDWARPVLGDAQPVEGRPDLGHGIVRREHAEGDARKHSAPLLRCPPFPKPSQLWSVEGIL